MAEHDPNLPGEDTQEEKSEYTPASFEKRIAAWMGIVYALLFFLIITFSMYCPDRSLRGTFPLFLVPVAVAAIVVTIYRQAKGTASGGLPMTVVIVLICLAAVAAGLFLGLPALAAALAG